MTQQQLIEYKLAAFLSKRDLPGLSAFVNSLVSNLTGTIQSVSAEVTKSHTEKIGHMNTAIANLQATIASLTAAPLGSTVTTKSSGTKPSTSTNSVAK
jgi:hypothetical protein